MRRRDPPPPPEPDAEAERRPAGVGTRPQPLATETANAILANLFRRAVRHGLIRTRVHFTPVPHLTLEAGAAQMHGGETNCIVLEEIETLALRSKP